jgi:glycosyltransferase involved in cell wall biosynthesis
MNCKSCNTEITSKFCHECGHPATLHRIDGHYILHEIQHVLHFEKGILFTIRELITNPGQNIRFYLSENRSRLVKPIIFIILTSLIYSLANHFFHFEDGYVNYLDNQPSTTTKIFKWIQGHYGWSNIIMGIFIAFWTKLFFKKYDFNFFEILILLCFVMGIGMLIYSVFGIAQGITQMKLMQFAGLFGFSYSAWAIGQFFEKKKVISYIKAISAYLLGMLTFSLVAILIGTIIDYTK